MKTKFKELKYFIILWLTQSLSELGSSMTNFALVIWIYQNSGSALTTALLMVCSYTPYVIMSIFAGAISDKWNKKKIMLVCDSLAAACTVIIFILLESDSLSVWHLYFLNAINGLMNTIQQPASDVAVTLLTPEKYYQKTSGMRSFSNSLVTILTPVLATALISFLGIETVILFDLLSFSAAFISLFFFIKIPDIINKEKRDENILQAAKAGLSYLKVNKTILYLILFLASINFISSIYSAALPAMVLSKTNENVLGIINTCTGIATLLGSMLAVVLPEPKNRGRVICNCLLISMSTENFILAFGNSAFAWYIGAIAGWLFVPLMNANMDVVFRKKIPAKMQGRVYSARNTLQFFTIPLGYFLGGLLVDKVFEPIMSRLADNNIIVFIFGNEKGSGAAFLFFIIGIAGTAVCLVFRKIKYIKDLK